VALTDLTGAVPGSLGLHSGRPKAGLGRSIRATHAADQYCWCGCGGIRSDRSQRVPLLSDQL